MWDIFKKAVTARQARLGLSHAPTAVRCEASEAIRCCNEPLEASLARARDRDGYLVS